MVVTQQVALSVPEGKIVIAVPTNSKLIENGLLRPGDFIDLMATFSVEVQRGTSKSPMPKTLSMLQNLEIHAIIVPSSLEDSAQQPGGMQPGGVFHTLDESGQSVLLAIDPQDALTIRHVLDVGGALDLALRPKGDETVAETEVVDEFYLADRYNIDLNRN